MEDKKVYVDPIIALRIPKWIKMVTKKDHDKVIMIDGEEGSGKSALAQQLAINIDPTFNIEKIAFTAEQFMNLIKDPKRKSEIISW